MINARKQYGTWIVYLVIVLFVVFSLDYNFAVELDDFLDYSLLLTLALIINFFPIRTNYSYYSAASGLALAVYVIYGLEAEIIFSSLATIMLIIRSDIKWDQHYRYALNLIMVIFLSFVSAGAYQGVSDLIGNNLFIGNQLLPLGSYVITYFVMNQVFAMFANKFYYRRKATKISSGHLDFVIKRGLLLWPMSFIIINLYKHFGRIGLLIGAVPYLALAIGAKFYYTEKNYNEFLVTINEYSRILSEMQKSEQIIHLFISFLHKIFPANRSYLYVPAGEGRMYLERIYLNDDESFKPEVDWYLDSNSSVAKTLETKRVYAFDKASEWQTSNFLEEDYRPESTIMIPLHILTKEKGVVIMTHQHQSVYDDFFIELVQVFYLYLRIILDNAFNYETMKASNFTDFLTDIPNFRGFTRNFEKVLEKGNYEELSLIVFDLDYFKQVNDVHGHEAGNEVLQQIARLLEDVSNEFMYPARYGGEEFVILLKDYNDKEAYDMAETIRKRIEETKFKITYSIATLQPALLKITASFGVATYPSQCRTEHDLIKLADRNMYSGSKQGGRNKVSMYTDNI